MLPEFELVQPKDLNEALAALYELGDKARPLAGGTDLLVAMKQMGLDLKCLVDISRLPELRGIALTPDKGLSIGAMTPLHAVETSAIVKRVCPVLAEAVGQIGSLQIRNRGTIGGNVANASPAADSAPSLLVLAAQLELVSMEGTRVIPIEDFFAEPGRTAIKQGELLRRILIPAPAPGTQSVYLVFGARKAMDCTAAGVAVSLLLDGDHTCRQARVGLGAVGPIPMRARKAEEALVGELHEQRIEQAAEAALEQACPISDVRASSELRCHLVKVLTRRSVKQAISRHNTVAARNA